MFTITKKTQQFFWHKAKCFRSELLFLKVVIVLQSMLALFKISVWMGKSYFVTKKRKEGGKIGFDNILSFLHQILNRTFLFHLAPQQVIELRTTTLSLSTLFSPQSECDDWKLLITLRATFYVCTYVQ